MDKQLDSDEIAYLLSQFLDRESSSFLEINEGKLLRKIRADATAFPSSPTTIKDFEESLSYFSRSKAKYQLKGKKRYNAFRRYKCFSPGSMLAGDLGFLHHLTPFTKDKSKTILVICDLFSKYCKVTLQKSNSAHDTLLSFKKSID